MSSGSCWSRGLWVALPVLLGGCDPQAGVGYQGQPLIRVTGSVELESSPEGKLVPALAFLDRESGELFFVDVEVHGEFPAEFSIDVFEPPPSGAFVTVSPLVPDEPKVAGGFITAVVEDHPASLRLGVAQGTLIAKGPDQTVTTESWCTADGSECYVETTTCPKEGEPCVTEHSGDERLAEDAFEKFAGFSENYRIIYVDEPVPAGSYTAVVAGEPDGLEPGYYLFELTPFSRAEAIEQEACWSEAAELALERYNAAHDSNYRQEELSQACTTSMGCAPPPPGLPPLPCEEPPPPDPPCREAPEGAWSDFEKLHELAKLDLDCQLGYERVERVLDPAHEPIEVRIGRMAMEPEPPQVAPSPVSP